MMGIIDLTIFNVNDLSLCYVLCVYIVLYRKQNENSTITAITTVHTPVISTIASLAFVRAVCKECIKIKIMFYQSRIETSLATHLHKMNLQEKPHTKEAVNRDMEKLIRQMHLTHTHTQIRSRYTYKRSAYRRAFLWWCTK